MIVVNLVGLLLIGAIAWWFWFYQGPEVNVSDRAVTVIVDNGIYQPSRIKINAGQPTTLQFVRKDSSPCAEMVLFPDLDISASLPLDKTASVSLPALEKGDYDFHCQMQMYRGSLIVQ